MERYALIIVGIVAIIGIIGSGITGKSTATYEDYCNPAACKAACGKTCAEYRSTTYLGKCPSSYILENEEKIYRIWSCD